MIPSVTSYAMGKYASWYDLRKGSGAELGTMVISSSSPDDTTIISAAWWCVGAEDVDDDAGTVKGSVIENFNIQSDSSELSPDPADGDDVTSYTIYKNTGSWY